MSKHRVARTKKTIGIFGGTFDPVHQAHVQVVESILLSNMCDEIWILPAAESPFKTNRASTPFRHRYEMARLAFAHLDRVKLNDVEKKLEKPSYTYKTLSYLKKQHPDYRFRLCLGSDNLVSFHKWECYREVLEIADLIIAKRPGFEPGQVDKQILEKCTFIDHKPVSLSSTEAREYMKIGDTSYPLPDAVLQYIQENELYKE